MSRKHIDLAPGVTITRGDDHAVGRFIQLSDQRYAGSGDDEQGEGYVLDWDFLFGFGTNLIGATKDDLYSDAKLLELTNKFCEENNYTDP